MDPLLAAIIAVLGIATGIFASHATLGKDVRQALTEIKDLARRIAILERAPIHFHRRATDAPDLEERAD